MYKLVVAAIVFFAVPRVAEAQQRPVRGIMRFAEYNDSGTTFVRMQPIRYATVTIKRGSTTVGTAMTGHDGYFSRYIDVAQLPAGQVLTLELKAENYAAHVYLDLDWGDDDLTHRVNRVIQPGTAEINFSHDFDAGEVAVHFSILDAITYARQYADAQRGDTDDISKVDVEYPEDSDRSSYSAGEISMQGPSIPGWPYGGGTTDDGWRDHVVIHEYAHHLEQTISDLQSGGDHRACSDPGHSYWFAWKEGFPTYFAWAVCAAYPPGLQPIAPEETPGESCPAASENTTRQVLWDLHDQANEAHDLVDGNRVAGGKTLRRVIFEIFDDEQQNDIPGIPPLLVPTTLSTFHDAWVARGLYTGSHVELDRILFAYGIVPHTYADATPISFTTPTLSVPAGQPITVTLRATQNGYAYGDEPLRARYSLLGIATGYTTLADVSYMPFLPIAFNTTLTIPANTAPGNYWIVVQIDPTNRIVESNENNNSKNVFIEVTP